MCFKTRSSIEIWVWRNNTPNATGSSIVRFNERLSTEHCVRLKTARPAALATANCFHHTARGGYNTLIKIMQQEKDRVRVASVILHPASIKPLISLVRWSNCVQRTTCPVVSNADSGVAAELANGCQLSLGARHAKSEGQHAGVITTEHVDKWGLIKFTVDTLKASFTVFHHLVHQLHDISTEVMSLFCSFLDGENPT